MDAAPPLADRPGYVLKRVDVALRAALDGALRAHGLTLAQYAALEQLAERPGRSSADLARGAFVSRQAMHQVLGGLVHAGLVAQGREGRALRLALTRDGAARTRAAARSVAAVEERMVAGFAPAERRRLLADLERCARVLEQG